MRTTGHDATREGVYQRLPRERRYQTRGQTNRLHRIKAGFPPA